MISDFRARWLVSVDATAARFFPINFQRKKEKKFIELISSECRENVVEKHRTK